MACVAGHVGVGAGQGDDVGGVFEVDAGREGAGPDDAVGAAERAQAAVLYGDVGVAEVADLLAEGDGQRGGLTGLEGFVGQLDRGRGGQGFHAVVAAGGCGAQVVRQVGVVGQHFDHVGGVFNAGRRCEGGGPGQAAVGGGQAAERAVLSRQVRQVKGFDFLAEGDGDGGGFAHFEGALVEHDALHRGHGDVHRVGAGVRDHLGVACRVAGHEHDFDF